MMESVIKVEMGGKERSRIVLLHLQVVGSKRRHSTQTEGRNEAAPSVLSMGCLISFVRTPVGLLDIATFFRSILFRAELVYFS